MNKFQWQELYKNYMMYAVRGGKIKLKTLIAPDFYKTLEVMVLPTEKKIFSDLTDTEFQVAVKTALAPSNAHDGFALLKKIRCNVTDNQLTMEHILAFALEWKRGFRVISLRKVPCFICL